MKNSKVFIYWFEFEDSATPKSDEQSNIYFYQTIILAPSSAEALSWGDTLSNELVKKGDAVSIRSSWLEDVIPVLITPNGHKAINWESISRKEIESYYQGTASSNDKLGKNINAFIYANSEKNAKRFWYDYLLENQLNYKVETCSKPAISITKVGMSVDWL